VDDPLRIIAAHSGVFLRREALDCGYDDKRLAALRRQRLIHRVRQGAYCFVDAWGALSPEERHLILARAVLRTTPGAIALSHTTALLAHGISVWGADLTRVHVTRLDSGSVRRERDVEHHVGVCSLQDVVLIGGVPVVRADRGVIEAATVSSLESAVVSADSALHRRTCVPDQLYARFKEMNHWPGSQKIHVMLGWMDGRAESVGESRSRLLFRREGIPPPDLQFEVRDENGLLLAITDFVWHDRRVFGEFDGKRKYYRDLRDDEEPGDVVFREKQREDLVRRLTGYSCGRLVWSDLGRPRQTAAYFRTVLGLS